MAFHPDRLTGKRRRRWEASVNWAPPMPQEEIPKVLRDRLRHPERVRGFAKVDTGKDGADPLSRAGRHYVVLIRNRVVAVDHPHAATLTLAEAMSGETLGRCRCFDVVEKWATARDAGPNGKKRKKSDAAMTYAVRKDEMPPQFVALFPKRRPPAGRYRVQFKPGENCGSSDPRQNAHFADPNEAAHPAPYVRPPWFVRMRELVVPKTERELASRLRCTLARYGLDRGVHVEAEGTSRAEDAAANLNGSMKLAVHNWDTVDRAAVACAKRGKLVRLRVSANTVGWWLRWGRHGWTTDPDLFPMELSPTADPDVLVGWAFDLPALLAAAVKAVAEHANGLRKPQDEHLLPLAAGGQVAVVLTRDSPAQTVWAAARLPRSDYRAGAGSNVDLKNLSVDPFDKVKRKGRGPNVLCPNRLPGTAFPPAPTKVRIADDRAD